SVPAVPASDGSATTATAGIASRPRSGDGPRPEERPDACRRASIMWAAVKLTVLGTCAAYPGPGRAATGYLVRHDGFNLVVDLGNGALANLQREIAFTEVDGILVSHSHPDHCVDLYALFIARMFHTERLPALPLFTAQGVFDRFSKLGNETDEMRRSFAVRELEPGESFDMGPFRIETRSMTHWVPALGYRLQVDGRTLAYTGDTGPTEEILPLGHEADLLVSEASWIDGQEV